MVLLSDKVSIALIVWLTCFILQWYFNFLSFRSFFLIKLLIFNRKLKTIDFISNFWNFNKKAVSPNRARKELTPTAHCEPVFYRDLIARSHFLACVTPKRPLSSTGCRSTAETERQNEYWSGTYGGNRSAIQKGRHLPDCADRATIIIYFRSLFMLIDSIDWLT